MNTTTSLPENTAVLSTDYDKILYYSVGGGGGFVVLVNIILCIVVVCRRYWSKKSQDKKNLIKDEGDELNVFTTSSNNAIDKESVDHHVHSFANNADGNYSTVELDGTTGRSNEENHRKNRSFDIDNEDKASTVQQTKMHSESKEDKERKSIKHVIAPGSKGYEYALVKKHEETTQSSLDQKCPFAIVGEPSLGNAYAVVDKTWKQKTADNTPISTETPDIKEAMSQSILADKSPLTSGSKPSAGNTYANVENDWKNETPDNIPNTVKNPAIKENTISSSLTGNYTFAVGVEPSVGNAYTLVNKTWKQHTTDHIPVKEEKPDIKINETETIIKNEQIIYSNVGVESQNQPGKKSVDCGNYTQIDIP